MRVIEPGHVYEVEHVDANDDDRRLNRHSTVIRFVRRRDDHGELLPEHDRECGILTQELLRVAIDRTLYLYAEAPCEEDTEILLALRRALVLYESRAARRNIEKLAQPEEQPVCPVCHHIFCTHIVRGTA